jgi:hypothetical protein
MTMAVTMMATGESSLDSEEKTFSWLARKGP